MKLRWTFVALTALTLTFAGAMAGCGGGGDAGDLPPPKLQTQDEADRVAKQVKDGAKGYKGAPGAPPLKNN